MCIVCVARNVIQFKMSEPVLNVQHFLGLTLASGVLLSKAGSWSGLNKVQRHQDNDDDTAHEDEDRRGGGVRQRREGCGRGIE